MITITRIAIMMTIANKDSLRNEGGSVANKSLE
jgi:hypothetical protein